MQLLLIVVLIVTWAVLLLTVLLVLKLVRRVNTLTAILTKQPDLAVGTPAPDFAAETISGQPVTLASYANRTALLVFVHPHCPSCRDELPMLESFALLAKRRANIELVLVSEGDPAETRALADEFKLRLPVVVAPRDSNSFARDYNPNGENPCYCLIDPGGTVVSKSLVGSPEWLSLRQAVEGPSGADQRSRPAQALNPLP